MRDINRIDKILAEIGEVWKRVPDWRLGQLFNNLQRYKQDDLFYVEDDKFVLILKEFLDDSIGKQCVKMRNSDKFEEVFGVYATELWSMSEQDFLDWLDDEYKDPLEMMCANCQEFDCSWCWRG